MSGQHYVSLKYYLRRSETWPTRRNEAIHFENCETWPVRCHTAMQCVWPCDYRDSQVSERFTVYIYILVVPSQCAQR